MKYGVESESASELSARLRESLGTSQTSRELPSGSWPLSAAIIKSNLSPSCQLGNEPSHLMQGAAHEVRRGERERLKAVGETARVPGHIPAGFARSAFSSSRLSTHSAVTDELPFRGAGSCA